jgi:hypothetical protein
VHIQGENTVWDRVRKEMKIMEYEFFCFRREGKDVIQYTCLAMSVNKETVENEPRAIRKGRQRNKDESKTHVCNLLYSFDFGIG